MLPAPPATLSRGGSPSTIQSTSPSDERETTDSTFSEIQVEVKVGDNGDIEVKSPVLDSMQRAAHNTPLPNGNGGDGGSGSDRPSPTPVRTRPEPYYSNEGTSPRPSLYLSMRDLILTVCAHNRNHDPA